MSTSQTQVNTMLQAEISMANASQALAQSQWAEATVAYRLACNAFAALRATALDDKIKQQHLWGHCQSLIGLAYALHQQDALAHQAEVEALFLSVKAYQQSRPFIQHCLRQEDGPWLGYYQTLQEALHIPDAPSVLPVDMLQELDAERAFEALMASLEIQCQHDNQQQTPFYLVITYELRHIFRAYCESAYHVINMTHQDVHGRTLLAHAAFHQRGYMQRMLEEKAARQEKQADDYQAFVARQYEWQKTPVAMSPIHQEEDTWLSNTLRQLMKSDAYEAAAEALRQAWSFTRRLLSHHGTYQGKMDALVQALLPPERLVGGPSAETRFASVWAPIMRETSPRWRSVTSLSAQTDTKRLGELINTLKQLIKTLPKGVAYQPLFQALTQLQDCYQAFEDAVRADARAIFYSQDEGPCYIPIENLGCFLSEYDNNEEVTKVSNGQVHAVHGARGMHIKEDPEAPGVEYETHALGNLLTGESSPPTRLVKLFHQNDDLLYMVSKTVEGESLQYICDVSPAYLEKIDPANFSRLVVLSIVTNPHDGKGPNYQVRPEYHVNGQGGAVMSTSASTSSSAIAQSPIVSGLPLAPVDSLKRIKITGIDNDDNFAREVTVGNDGRHAVGIHCILYSLSAMKQPVDVGVKQQLLYRKPAVLVLRWLHLLQIQNQHYATLNARGVLSDTQYRAAHIKLYPGTAREIYHKLVHIQTLLAEDRDNTLTHADLLRHVQPLVYLVYKRLAKGWLSPEGARKRLTPTQVYEALCDASKRGAWSIETLLADILDTELVPGEGVTIKEYLSTQTARESDYFNERKQSLEDAITDFVAHLSLDALPPDEATMVVSQLAESPLPIRALVLRRSSLTTDEIEHLLLESLGNKDNKGRFGAQGLQTLDLIDCNAVFADGDRMIARGEAYGVRVRLLRLVDERIPSPSSAPIDIENTLTTLTDSPSAFNLFFKSPPNSPLLLPSLLQRKLPMPIRHHWYKDHDIDDYVSRAITLAPLGGHGQHEYRVYGADGAETIHDNRDKLPYHTFLLRAVGVVDAEPSTQPSSSQASAEIAGGHDAQSTSPTLSLLMQTMDKWTKEPTQLMFVVQTAMQGDSRDDFISALHEVTTLDTPYDRLHDLVAEHPTWDSLKPALIAFIDEQRGIDLADELFPCLAAPNAQAKILFALNESQAHWFVGELLLSKITTETATETKVIYRLAAYAHDPYGGGQMPESMANAMHAALLRRLHMQDSSITHIELTRPASPYRRRQAEGDGDSCGVVVAHDMVKRLKGQTLTISRPYPYGARTLRNQQSTLVGRELGAPEPASSPLPKPDVAATAAVDELDNGQASSASPPVSPLSQIKPEAPQAEQASPPTRGSQRGAIRAPVGRPARERTKSTLTPRFDRRLEDGDPGALCYEVPYDAYEMVLDAIRASTADRAHHYLPFIQLLTCQDYALRADASAEEEIARRQRINQLVEGTIMTTSQSGRRRLLGVPLHCRQHFSVDDITRFYDIAGSVSPMASADDWQRNLAIWAVIFSAPYIGCEQATMGEHVEPTQAIATYFREHFDALWTLPYPGAYSAEALYAVLHPRDDGRHKSRASLMVELDNAALKGFYSYIASCWRENHYYIEHWDVKHTRLTQINAKHWVVYRLAYPVWMIEKAIRGILEEKVFLSRRLDSLRLFAVLLGLLTSPTPDAYLSHLDTPGYQPGFLNGGLFRRIMTGYQLPEGSPIREVITSGALQAPLRQTVLDEEERAKLENEARALREQVDEKSAQAEQERVRAEQAEMRAKQAEARAEIGEEIDEAASILFQIAQESVDSQKKMSPMINDAKQMYNNVLHLRDQIASLGGDLSQLQDVMQSCLSAKQHCQTVIERCKAAERRTKDLCAQKEIMRTQFRTAKAAEQEKSLEVLIDSLPAYRALGQTLLIAIAETAQAYKEQLNGYLEVTEIYREAMKVYQEAESSFQALKEEARAAQAQRQREADEAARREHERAEEERARADEEARKRRESEDDARRARERAENAEKRLAAIEAEAEAKKARKAAKKATKAQKQTAGEAVAPKVGTSTEPESSGHSRAHHQAAPSQPGTSEAGFFASSPQRPSSAIPSAALPTLPVTMTPEQSLTTETIRSPDGFNPS